MHAFLVFNPASGSYSAAAAQQIVGQLLARGVTAVPITPASEADAREQVRRICETVEQPFLIAAGGDGTVNTVINGMIPGKGTLAVMPLGTANVIGHELKIRSTGDAIERIVRGNALPFNVGVATGSGQTRRFLLMAGVGFDGEVVATIRGTEKKRFGKGAYLLSALRILARNVQCLSPLSVGHTTTMVRSVIISNASHYAGKFVAAPTAIFDPEFCIIQVPTESRSRLLRFALTTAVTGIMPSHGMQRFSAGETITIGGNSWCQLDGDPFVRAPLSVSMMTNFARIIV